MLLERGLFRNLVYGISKLQRMRHSVKVQGHDVPEERERVMTILKRFSRFDRLRRQLQAEYDHADLLEGDGTAWRVTLSYAEQAMVHIVRALVMNPEVMVLQRPMTHFDHHTQESLMQALKDHVAERGLEMGFHPKELRRPRTVIYSTEYEWAAKMADVQLVLEAGEGARHYEGEKHDYNEKREESNQVVLKMLKRDANKRSSI
jgi:ABC-type Na+ transport system ATPase subunit NatA